MPKGKKFGGRSAGTPNKKTRVLLEICEAQGISPFEAILDLCKHDDVSIKLSALKEVCQYLYPKRKAVEMDVNVLQQKVDAMSEADFVREAEEKLKKIKGRH